MCVSADVDECNFEESCRRELGNVCVNTDGSYACVCQAGFREHGAACVGTSLSVIGALTWLSKAALESHQHEQREVFSVL